jgi:PhoH-like ATPase
MPPKLFVLDTNVILHDSTCIDQFEEHDVAIPMVVLEELDGFKKGEHEIGYHARHFLRRVDSLSPDSLFADGVSIGDERGTLTVELTRPLHDDLAGNFDPAKPDHKILNCAYILSKRYPDRDVILISKDVNLRLKAKAVGLMVQDYHTDRVVDVQALYSGVRMREGIESDTIKRLLDFPNEISLGDVPDVGSVIANEYFTLKNGKHSALARFEGVNQVFRQVRSRSVYNIEPRNVEQTFAIDALMNKSIPLVTLSGRAGTGKTLLALAAALEQRKEYKQILVARPIVPLSNRDTGFLPGEIDDKLAPYMQPLFDNLGVIRHQFAKSDSRHRNILQLLESEKLVIAPLSYIRGRSLVDAYFIVDEGQNLTPHEIKTIITRAGEGAKIVITGDIFQIDHPYLDTESNGLSYLIKKMRGQPMYAHINLEKGERSKLSELASTLL